MSILILVAHAPLGAALTECARQILGNLPPSLKVIDVNHYKDQELLVAEVKEVIEKLKSEPEILVLTDVIGATPANLIASLLQPGRIEGVAGVNLPMLLRSINYHHKPLPELLKLVLECGETSVIAMNECYCADRN